MRSAGVWRGRPHTSAAPRPLDIGMFHHSSYLWMCILVTWLYILIHIYIEVYHSTLSTALLNIYLFVWRISSARHDTTRTNTHYNETHNQDLPSPKGDDDGDDDDMDDSDRTTTSGGWESHHYVANSTFQQKEEYDSLSSSASSGSIRDSIEYQT